MPTTLAPMAMAPVRYQLTEMDGTLGGTRLKSPLMLKCGRLMCGNCRWSPAKKPLMALSAPDTVFFAPFIVLSITDLMPLNAPLMAPETALHAPMNTAFTAFQTPETMDRIVCMTPFIATIVPCIIEVTPCCSIVKSPVVTARITPSTVWKMPEIICHAPCMTVLTAAMMLVTVASIVARTLATVSMMEVRMGTTVETMTVSAAPMVGPSVSMATCTVETIWSRNAWTYGARNAHISCTLELMASTPAITAARNASDVVHAA